MKSKIWLSSPHMGGTEEKFVKEAFDTNWIAPLGPNLNGFEEDLAKYLGQNNGVAALSSGSAALHLALILLGIQQGDCVLCQDMTFAATAFPINYVKAKPYFIDSETATWNMDPDLLEKAINIKLAEGIIPKAIIVVDLYGMPARLNEILAISNKYNIPLIEDAAEALGSSIHGRRCGTYGQISILSFNGNKIITTSGGGALVSENPEWVQQAKFLSTQARDSAPHYQHSTTGYNYRLSNICAGIGRGQMEVLDQRINQRRKNFEEYCEQLSGLKGVSLLMEPNGYFSNRWLTTILVDEKIAGFTREDLRIAFEKENIESRPLWKPMHLQPVFADADYLGNGISDRLFNQGLCLPSGSNLTNDDKQRIYRVIDSMN